MMAINLSSYFQALSAKKSSKSCILITDCVKPMTPHNMQIQNKSLNQKNIQKLFALSYIIFKQTFKA